VPTPKKNKNVKPKPEIEKPTDPVVDLPESVLPSKPEPESPLPSMKDATEANIGAEINEHTSPASQEPIPEQSGNEEETSNESSPPPDSPRFTVDEAVGGMGGPSTNTSSSFNGENGNETFNPAIHCVGADGTPRLNKDGSFRQRPGRKVGGSSNNRGYVPPPPSDNSDKFTNPAPPTTFQVVNQTLQVVTLALSQSVGPEWKLNPEEQQTLADVYSRYVHYRGWDEVCTPESVVLLATLSILGPRILPRIMQLVQGRKRKVVTNAHPDRRPNGVGKVNPSEGNNGASTENEASFGARPSALEGVGQYS
jgi:hypothetical protein